MRKFIGFTVHPARLTPVIMAEIENSDKALQHMGGFYGPIRWVLTPNSYINYRVKQYFETLRKG